MSSVTKFTAEIMNMKLINGELYVLRWIEFGWLGMEMNVQNTATTPLCSLESLITFR